VEIKVLGQVYNPLLKRKEVKVEITHSGAGTPDRFMIRKELASRLDAKLDNVYVVDVETKTGTEKTRCDIEVYDVPERARKIVPSYIIARNKPPEERKKEAKPAEAPKKAEKREEKKPPEPKKK
jgi:ribosomal protein S24E